MQGRIVMSMPPCVRYFCWVIFCVGALNVQAQTDSLPVYNLAGFTVVVPQVRLPISAPVASLKRKDIFRYDGSSLLAGFNGIPGARFEERAPGSYRISIRGSSLRAPFGVRNVKVYWNGLPLTEPGGDTPLNFIDPINVNSLLVFKGPAGSLYGSGTGGAMLLSSALDDTVGDVDQLNVQMGSFGSARLAWLHRRENSPGNVRQISLVHNRTDGYRRHSQLARTVGELSLYRQGENGGGGSLHILATDLHYEIPGGLNPEQFADNPRQARSGSEASRAAINYQNILIGGRSYGELANGFLRHASSLYTTTNSFDHPFNIDHKREENLGIGGRSVLTHERNIPQLGALKLDLGMEVQLAHKAARNYAPDAGQPGDLSFVDDIDTRQILTFLQGDLRLAQQWEVVLGLSLQQVRYQVDRTFNISGATGLINSNFAWVAAPRLSVAKAWKWGDANYSAFASYGRAYSPPTLREFRTNEGSLNTDLKAERGNSYEVGLRRRSALGFNLDLNVYLQRLSETITTFQDENDVQLFRNAGSSRQFGIEVAIERDLFSGPHYDDAVINSLVARVAYTYQSGQYRNYQPNGNDFSGQDLPGLTPHTFDWQLTARTSIGYYAGLGLYTSGRTPLDDANEVFAESFAVLRARIGYVFDWRGRTVNAYLGGDNLLNQTYSLGYDLNPQFGRRYFQPAAGRSIFLGVRLNFNDQS
ncbi:MAG: TonB-dependent receptor [Bacteroidota bacterium]